MNTPLRILSHHFFSSSALRFWYITNNALNLISFFFFCPHFLFYLFIGNVKKIKNPRIGVKQIIRSRNFFKYNKRTGFVNFRMSSFFNLQQKFTNRLKRKPSQSMNFFFMHTNLLIFKNSFRKNWYKLVGLALAPSISFLKIKKRWRRKDYQFSTRLNYKFFKRRHLYLFTLQKLKLINTVLTPKLLLKIASKKKLKYFYLSHPLFFFKAKISFRKLKHNVRLIHTKPPFRIPKNKNIRPYFFLQNATVHFKTIRYPLRRVFHLFKAHKKLFKSLKRRNSWTKKWAHIWYLFYSHTNSTFNKQIKTYLFKKNIKIKIKKFKKLSPLKKFKFTLFCKEQIFFLKNTRKPRTKKNVLKVWRAPINLFLKWKARKKLSRPILKRIISLWFTSKKTKKLKAAFPFPRAATLFNILKKKKRFPWHIRKFRFRIKRWYFWVTLQKTFLLKPKPSLQRKLFLYNNQSASSVANAPKIAAQKTCFKTNRVWVFTTTNLSRARSLFFKFRTHKNARKLTFRLKMLALTRRRRALPPKRKSVKHRRVIIKIKHDAQKTKRPPVRPITKIKSYVATLNKHPTLLPSHFCRFTLSAIGFLKLTNTLFINYTNQNKQNLHKVKKNMYTFTYSNDIRKRIIKKNARIAKLAKVKKKFRKRKSVFLKKYYNPVKLQLTLKDSPTNTNYNTPVSNVKALVAATFKSRHNFAALKKVHKKKLKKRRLNLKIKRIRFRPGYMRVWRRARRAALESFDLTFKYQHRLTQFLLDYKKILKISFLPLFEMRLKNVLIRSRLVIDKIYAHLMITTKNVFVNGFFCLNPDFQVYANDFVQLIVSFKYYITFRWFLNRAIKIKKKMKRLSWKHLRYTPKPKTDKKRNYNLPAYPLRHQNLTLDVAKYLEVDFFSLSLFVLYSPFLWNDLNKYNATLIKHGLVNVYNWKYIT